MGLRYSLSPHTTALAQINALYRWHNRGARAERSDSGGRYVFFSPGVSRSFASNWQLYGYAQLPLYQHVNGIQLTAKWTAVVGISRRF